MNLLFLHTLNKIEKKKIIKIYYLTKFCFIIYNMDTISEYDNLTITEAYDILEKIKDIYSIGFEPLLPTYTWYPGCDISYKQYQACKKKIQCNGIKLNTGFQNLHDVISFPRYIRCRRITQ